MLVAVSTGTSAVAAERLTVEVIPVTVKTYQYWKADPQPLVGKRADPTAALQAVLSAMKLLKVPASLYNVVLADESLPQLDCWYAGTLTSRVVGGTGETVCGIDDDGDGTGEILYGDRLAHLMSDRFHLGGERGRVLVAVLSHPIDFSWFGTLGAAALWYWDDGTHHTRRSCSIWAISVPTVVAHELGHCFGLYHNGPDDGNHSGRDDVVDLMHPTSHLLITHLRPSNVSRVRTQFRRLPAPTATEGRLGSFAGVVELNSSVRGLGK